MEQTSPNSTSEAPVGQDQHKTLMGVLAYLGILIVIPYMMAKDNSFVKFHIRQGLVLIVIELGTWVLAMFMWQLWPIVQLVHLGTIVLAIMGIINVIQNKEAELPLVGSFAQKFSI